MKYIKKIIFWLNNSRLFSLPMTVMSWLLVFIYALKEGGSIINGILALVGIVFAHLATNLVDDYIDYKTLSKNKNIFQNTLKSKFAYIKSGEADIVELLRVIIIYCTIAFVIGIILTVRCGYQTAILAILGGLIVLFYPKLSNHALSELAVGTAFGPLLFEGVYFVMTGEFSFSVLILSIASVIFTITLLYVHNFLDYEADIASNKNTLCTKIGKKFDKIANLHFLTGMCTTSYILIFVLAVINRNPFYLISFGTIPLLIFIIKNLKKYNENKDYVPKIKWWNFPLDNWNKVLENGTAPFYFNLLQARNLATWFMLSLSFAILI